ncbi:DUF2716 domain-containing protein [Streptomyces rimosus]|uniref:DUF2716 domain-containing protein n=1 Tax=Streptomyces rimosus TaxID=1927 RepID=UPI0004C4C13C|nr:DUF2716 domain-containing protein [Streptomyces rimosus]
MTEEPVAELSRAESDDVWRRFYSEFEFRPSMNSFQWPGIKEPAGSVTWSLAALDDDPDYVRLDRLGEAVQAGLTASVAPQDRLFALDWQHTCYGFLPHRVGGPDRMRWPLSPIPDGDYYIYLSNDFRLGSFGHPWEYTLCLFGREFVDAVAAEVDGILGPPIRRSGRAA